MDHLKPLALCKEDAPLLSASCEEAHSICMEAGVLFFNTISLALEERETEALDKERLLTYLESLPVLKGIQVTDIEQNREYLESADFAIFPDFLHQLWQQFAGDQSCVADDLHRSDVVVSIPVLQEKLTALIEELKSRGEQGLRIPYCNSPWTKFFVEAEGGTRPCDVWQGHISDLTVNADFEAAWQSQELVQLRRATHNEAELTDLCKNCKFGERHLYINDINTFLSEIGLDPEKVPKPSRFLGKIIFDS